jgi:Ca-activated chloride channel family protein
VRFKLADGLYKNGQYDEAATLFRSLGVDAAAPFAPAARFNLGNSLYQKKDFKGAIKAYRDALRVAPNDEDTRRNLEMALRQLKEQEEQQKREQEQKKDQDQQDQEDDKDQKNQQKQDQENKDQESKDQKPQDQDKDKRDQKDQPQDQKRGDQKEQDRQQGQPPRPQTPEEKEDQRFREQVGMPKERAMQLLDALQENEKAEQKRLLEEQRAKKRTGRDW